MVNLALVVTFILAALALAVLWKLEHWWDRWRAERFVAGLIANPPKLADRPKLNPESKYLVEFGADKITCTLPDGEVETVTWSKLQSVAILTNSLGPFAPDTFWVLNGENDGCLIPWGATGEQGLLQRLQALAGFRNETIVEAASLTNDNYLICWQRPAEPAVT